MRSKSKTGKSRSKKSDRVELRGRRFTAEQRQHGPHRGGFRRGHRAREPSARFSVRPGGSGAGLRGARGRRHPRAQARAPVDGPGSAASAAQAVCDRDAAGARWRATASPRRCAPSAEAASSRSRRRPTSAASSRSSSSTTSSEGRIGLAAEGSTPRVLRARARKCGGPRELDPAVCRASPGEGARVRAFSRDDSWAARPTTSRGAAGASCPASSTAERRG